MLLLLLHIISVMSVLLISVTASHEVSTNATRSAHHNFTSQVHGNATYRHHSNSNLRNISNTTGPARLDTRSDLEARSTCYITIEAYLTNSFRGPLEVGGKFNQIAIYTDYPSEISYYALGTDGDNWAASTAYGWFYMDLYDLTWQGCRDPGCSAWLNTRTYKTTFSTGKFSDHWDNQYDQFEVPSRCIFHGGSESYPTSRWYCNFPC